MGAGAADALAMGAALSAGAADALSAGAALAEGATAADSVAEDGVAGCVCPPPHAAASPVNSTAHRVSREIIVALGCNSCRRVARPNAHVPHGSNRFSCPGS